MTQLNKETIKKLTQLSRIACSEEEQESILHDLAKILDYMELLKEIDTENVPPCNHVLEDVKNVMREDVVGPTLSRDAFLANAPSQVGGMIKVPPVIKQNNQS
jgi:aspartyl-tRNA(Asn)/glutamyl-tRNA(Gln) amidotransferase subunit C